MCKTDNYIKMTIMNALPKFLIKLKQIIEVTKGWQPCLHTHTHTLREGMHVAHMAG